MKNAKIDNSNFNYFDNAYDACQNSDAIIIGTEWDEFKSINFSKISKLIKTKKIFDLRNIFDQFELEKIGYKYYGTGK